MSLAVTMSLWMTPTEGGQSSFIVLVVATLNSSV